MTGNVTLKESDKSSGNQTSWLKLKFEAVLKNVQVANAHEISVHLFDSAKMFIREKLFRVFSLPVACERA